MTYRSLFLLVALLMGFAAPEAHADSPPEFSGERMKAAVQFLASDRLEGRGLATRGEALATEYIADEFKKAGLKPLGVRGIYFQPVPLLRIATNPKSSGAKSRAKTIVATNWSAPFPYCIATDVMPPRKARRPRSFDSSWSSK